MQTLNYVKISNHPNALQQALSAATTKVAERVGSTATRMLAHKESNKIITRLDPIIRKIYRNNPAKLAEWDFASHVQGDEKPKPPPNNG